jgi:hypothetical protein
MISGASTARANTRRATGALLLAGAILIAAAPARADDAAPGGWDLAQLMKDLAQVRAVKGRFVEKKYLSVLKTPLESSGTLRYDAPDRLEKNTLLPRPETLVLERDRLSIDSDARNEHRSIALQEYPEVAAFVESVRATLAGDLDTLSRYYKATLEGRAADWKLLLTPVDAKMRGLVKRVRIAGGGNWVQSIEIEETGGDRSVMTVQRESAP